MIFDKIFFILVFSNLRILSPKFLSYRHQVLKLVVIQCEIQQRDQNDQNSRNVQNENRLRTFFSFFCIKKSLESNQKIYILHLNSEFIPTLSHSNFARFENYFFFAKLIIINYLYKVLNFWPLKHFMKLSLAIKN